MKVLKKIDKPSTWHFYDTKNLDIAFYRSLTIMKKCQVHDAFGPFSVKYIIHFLEGNQVLNISGWKYKFNPGNTYFVTLPEYSILKGELNGSFEAYILIEKMKPKNLNGPPQISQLPNGMKSLISKPQKAYDFLKVQSKITKTNLVQPMNRNPKIHVLSRKTKNLIDHKFHTNLKLSDIARQLNTNEAQISRNFKSSFDMNPLKYRNLIRITTASFEILKGQSVTEACFRSGFQDVSRFYKQFKALSTITPALLSRSN